LRRVVALATFLREHLFPAPKAGEGGNFDADTNLSEKRERYRQKILGSERTSLDSALFSGTTGKPEVPTWWTFLEDEREVPADGVTYTEELMLSRKDIEAIRQEGGVVVLVPAHVLADRTYKPCALDAFCKNTSFRPDHSERSHGMTRPARTDLKGHPELISQSYQYSSWQSRLKKIDLERLEPSA